MVFRIKKCAWEEKEKSKVYESGEESESFKQQKVVLISCEQSSHAFHFVKSLVVPHRKPCRQTPDCLSVSMVCDTSIRHTILTGKNKSKKIFKNFSSLMP